jgi:hypothetical protein
MPRGSVTCTACRSAARHLDKVRGHDDMSFALVAGLPGAEAHHRADVQAALAGGPGSESMTAEQPWPWPETMACYPPLWGARSPPGL